MWYVLIFAPVLLIVMHLINQYGSCTCINSYAPFNNCTLYFQVVCNKITDQVTNKP